MKLVLRAAAARDLDGVFDYTAARHGEGAAETYLRAIQEAADRLCFYPEHGAVSALRPGLRVLAAQEHRLFYRIEGDKIVIVRVLHRAMDSARHL